jgi:molecular chaperone HtpG
MSTGKIQVTADNIFPIIKKFLYSDHEVFLRELVSNAVDATQKLKTLSSLGEAKGELGDLTIQIKVDKKKKTLTISDRGVGMSADEINRYINEVAFSGAEEFLKKYEGKLDGNAIIGHFGLGFYSAFMVADKVEILTKSHTDAPAAHWECKGDPEFTLKEGKKKDRGTDIVLHINEENKDFLEDYKIKELLNKYCKFLPVPIQFGEKEVTEGEGDDKKTVTVPNIINNPKPAWTRTPAELTAEDYDTFYRELYPMGFDKPLFHIHLNVDYPFDLTGILYFPKLKPTLEVQKNKIQLYQNQVFVTDSVEGIVPDFLTFLHGVLDSKDIPLNVSRSYLQADQNVKKISSHITKKVADRLEEMFKSDRTDFESKWDDMKIVVEYGMLTEEKFNERAKKFYLIKSTEGTYKTLEEWQEALQAAHTDKDKNLVVLYTSDAQAQHTFIEKAQAKGYTVLVMDTPLTSHLVERLERDGKNLRFVRVDADSIDRLIAKADAAPSLLTDEQKKEVESWVQSAIAGQHYHVEVQDLDSDTLPLSLVRPEFMRRMKEMSMTGGGFPGMGDMPDSYTLVVNANAPLVQTLMAEPDKRNELIEQGLDLAMLAQGLLKGERLTRFVERNFKNL